MRSQRFFKKQYSSLGLYLMALTGNLRIRDWALVDYKKANLLNTV